MAIFTISDFLRIITAYVGQIGEMGDTLFKSHINNVTNNVKLISDNIIEQNKSLDDKARKLLEFSVIIKYIIEKNEIPNADPNKVIIEYLNVLLDYSKSL